MAPLFELALLRYKMLQVNKGQAYRQSIVDLIGIQQLSETELRTLATIWKDNHSLQDTLPDKDVLQLAMKLSPFLELGVAEEVFKAFCRIRAITLNHWVFYPEKYHWRISELTIVTSNKNMSSSPSAC